VTQTENGRAGYALRLEERGTQARSLVVEVAGGLLQQRGLVADT
jgi:hypothetical protein